MKIVFFSRVSSSTLRHVNCKGNKCEVVPRLHLVFMMWENFKNLQWSQAQLSLTTLFSCKQRTMQRILVYNYSKFLFTTLVYNSVMWVISESCTIAQWMNEWNEWCECWRREGWRGEVGERAQWAARRARDCERGPAASREGSPRDCASERANLVRSFGERPRAHGNVHSLPRLDLT